MTKTIKKIDENTIEVTSSESVAETTTTYKKDVLERNKAELQSSIDSQKERMEELDLFLSKF